MKNNYQEFEHHNSTNNAIPVLAGLLVGGLAGAGAMLLLAPQPGKETRALIQQKAMQLRDRTAETVEGALSQAKLKTHQITSDVRGKADELQHQGQEMIAGQLDRVAAAAQAGKAALKNSEPKTSESGRTASKNS